MLQPDIFLIKKINFQKEFYPLYVVSKLEALSIEVLTKLEVEGLNIVPKARNEEITMNRDKLDT